MKLLFKFYLGVIAGGIGGAAVGIVGGPPGMIAGAALGGIAGGTAMDGITTGVESLIRNEFKPNGNM